MAGRSLLLLLLVTGGSTAEDVTGDWTHQDYVGRRLE
jgi:hypothetical protein